MSWFVYILVNGTRKTYVGITNDLERRLKAHNNGTGAKYTRGRGPWRYAYTEPHPNRSEASKREYALKHSSERYRRIQDV